MRISSFVKNQMLNFLISTFYLMLIFFRIINLFQMDMKEKKEWKDYVPTMTFALINMFWIRYFNAKNAKCKL